MTRIIKLSRLDQGNITLFWDELERSIRESIPDCTEHKVSAVFGQLRAGGLTAIGVWADGKIAGMIITGVATDIGEPPTAVVYAIHGDLERGEWADAALQLENILITFGVCRIIGYTNEASGKLARDLGWERKEYYVKELGDG